MASSYEGISVYTHCFYFYTHAFSEYADAWPWLPPDTLNPATSVWHLA